MSKNMLKKCFNFTREWRDIEFVNKTLNLKPIGRQPHNVKRNIESDFTLSPVMSWISCHRQSRSTRRPRGEFAIPTALMHEGNNRPFDLKSNVQPKNINSCLLENI